MTAANAVILAPPPQVRIPPIMTKPLHTLTLAVLAIGPALAADHAAPEAVRAEAREMYRTVIGFRTQEGAGQVPVMANWLADQFRAAGFPAEDVHVLPLGETASLVVRYRGTGKGGRPILFLAHMDVVTANREDWQRDPFTLVEEDGYFYGRGTNDIKSDITTISMAFLRLKRTGFRPTRDLIIAFSGDEETTQATTRDLVTRHRAVLGDAEFALNGDGGGGVLDAATGEPQLFYVQGGEKAYASFELTVRNPGGHSSMPRKDNAIYELADALKALQAWRFRVMWNDWTLGSLKESAANVPGEAGKAMARFAANPRDQGAAEALFDLPDYVGRTRTTCVPTLLQGGHAENALPQSATATVNCRVFPGMGIDEVQATLQRVVGASVEVKALGEPAVADASPRREDVMRAVTRAVHSRYPKVRIVPDMAPYTTDGVVFRGAGIPTYGIGGIFLKDGDGFAHGLNERLPVEAFYYGLDHWYVIIQELAGKR